MPGTRGEATASAGRRKAAKERILDGCQRTIVKDGWEDVLSDLSCSRGLDGWRMLLL